MNLNFEETIAGLPPEWPEDPLPAIQAALAAAPTSTVVFDDDPTGTQTAHDVPVLTEWSEEALHAELAAGAPLFYVLTNSRALAEDEAVALAEECGRNLAAAARRAGREFRAVSRSDSTLRGHYPAEVDALAAATGRPNALQVILPFFLEGGRFTIDDVHYVQEGGRLTPAAETPFARDASFGYRASNLKDWVAEKTGGRVSAEDVAAISLDDIRRGGPGRVAELLGQTEAPACVVNAVSMRDAEVVALALLQAERKGLTFVLRGAASIVRALGGLRARELLTRDELALPAGGAGLIVVGSHVPQSSKQLAHLRERTNAWPVELCVRDVLSPDGAESEIARLAAALNDGLKAGKDMALFTSRRPVTADDAESSLGIAGRVSAALVEIVRRLNVWPRYILAKGGITSSDLATRGLRVRRAEVLGQILPGVPVWRLGAESAYPALPYIVFPGNVGADDALTRIVNMLRSE